MVNLNNVLDEICNIGGEVYFVGGYVRDSLLGKENKDIDIEIFNITPNRLKEALSKFGTVDDIGASFGVLKLHGLDVDFAMPRSESKSNLGHKGFDVNVNPFMNTKDASKRRDLTINSLMKNYKTGEIIDHFNGLSDLKNGLIKHIDDKTFVEDELRSLRACQFAARLNFKIAKETIELCKGFKLNILPQERIFEELSKALLKSNRPSIFFENLYEMGLIKQIFTPIDVLKTIEQNLVYHPEGNVWNHTMLVIDELAKLRNKSNYPLALMLAGICHDFGKIKATKILDGKIMAHGHENILDDVEIFLNNICNNKDLINSVILLVRNHMKPNSKGVVFEAKDSTIRRLIVKAKGKRVDIKDLLLLAEADHKGRLNAGDYNEEKVWFDKKIKDVCNDNDIKPVIQGRDLIKLGLKPSKEFKIILDRAFELQLDGLSKEEIINRLEL